MRRKKEDSEQARSGGDARLSPADIQQVEFRLAFRGYNERDVDAFLDRITEDISTYIEEIQRLRSGTGAASPDAATSGNGSEAAAREAEEIVARAKERAAEIVRAAEITVASASSGGSAATTAGADPRGVIAPFLNRERDFLQSLGGLVQGHAEEIKQMVLSLRARSEPEPGRTRGEPVAAQSPPVSRAQPVVLPEAAETARAAEPEPVPAEHPSGERSLKDLFWGED
jgi:DivIVA domain-containing protein